MITCKAVANLLLSDLLGTQKWWKRVEVHIHLAMCGMCSRFARQLEQLALGARHWSRQNDGDADLEERLIQRLSRD